jgi:CRP-like cAMP-binding protein
MGPGMQALRPLQQHASIATGGPAAAAAPPPHRLLARLPSQDLERLLPRFEVVDLAHGRILYEPGSPASHVYFPISAVVSLLYLSDSGASAEVAMIGQEGVVGLSALMGGESADGRAVVQAAGRSLRIKPQDLAAEFNQGGALMQLLLRCTQAMMLQMGQAAVCNRHHAMERQLCRWLLQSLDRRHSVDLAMTQELLAMLLGVRRESVTEVAKKLQTAGLIRYARGHIVVLDRAGLQARSCECYARVRRDQERLLPGLYTST